MYTVIYSNIYSFIKSILVLQYIYMIYYKY